MAYQCPPPAFTLCRVTSVIGSTPIKSLLNLIAPIFPSEIQNIKDFLTPQLSDLCSLCKCARYSRKGSAKMTLTTISSDFTRLATHRYAGSVFWISPFTRCYVLKSSGSFSISSFCLFGGLDWWLMRENCYLSMKRKTLLEYFSPNPDWTILTHPCLKLLFLILHPILPAAWSFIFTIILSLIIMPNVAQWSLIVIYRAPIPNFKNCFPDKKKFIDNKWFICWFLCSRETTFSVHTIAFDWPDLDQSRLANQMSNNLPIASCCTVDIPCST